NNNIKLQRNLIDRTNNTRKPQHFPHFGVCNAKGRLPGFKCAAPMRSARRYGTNPARRSAYFYSLTGQNPMRTIANLLWKILKWALIALIFLIVLVFVIAKVPAVQNYILGHGINYFNSKSEGELQVGRLTMNLPFHVG